MVCTEETAFAAIEQARFEGGLAASGAESTFPNARFTRDYLISMGALMLTHPGLVRQGFSQIPEDQGVRFDARTEEQPDRLPHQVVRSEWGNTDAYRHWADKWGIRLDSGGGFVVYNQTDGLDYVNRLAEFCRFYGKDVLNDRFTHRPTGQIRTVAEAALRTLNWGVNVIKESDSGLLEVPAFNNKQTSWSGVLRDGADSYFHPIGKNGHPLNRDAPIAYLRNQGIAVDAFRSGLELFPDSEKASEWDYYACELAKRTLDIFTKPDGTLVPAIDRNDFGKQRQVDLVSSEVVEFLKYSVLGRDSNSIDIVTSVLTQYLPSLLTPVGLRMIDPGYAELEGAYWSYQGSRTVWPVETEGSAEGVGSFDFAQLSYNLSKLMINGLQMEGRYIEYHIIDSQNNIFLARNRVARPEANMTIAAAELPANPQTWTSAKAIKVLRSLAEEPSPPRKGSWQSGVNKKLAPLVNDMVRQTDFMDQSIPFFVDLDEGRRLRSERFAA